MNKKNFSNIKKPKGKSHLKKIAGWLHLWLGLITGTVVVILGVTGCLFVFQKEITDILYAKETAVAAPPDKKQLPISVLIAKAEQSLGKGKKVGFIIAYKEPTKAWEFVSFKVSNPNAFWYFDTVDHYQSAFVNPYSGAITLIKNNKYGFFNVVKMIHWSLLINHPIGQQIISWSTVIFVLMLITGLILWWPKNLKKSNFNKSFKINWKAQFKRLNYDLHNVSGFYVLLIALVLALTGLMFAFNWFENTVKQIADIGQVKLPVYPKILISDTTKASLKNGINIGFAQAKILFADKTRIGINLAYNHKAPHIFFGCKSDETYYHFDELHFDQYTGKHLETSKYLEKTPGEKLLAMKYDIHVGAILGLPGKILAFSASLIAAGLPITGFIIWLGRKKKKIYV